MARKVLPASVLLMRPPCSTPMNSISGSPGWKLMCLVWATCGGAGKLHLDVSTDRRAGSSVQFRPRSSLKIFFFKQKTAYELYFVSFLVVDQLIYKVLSQQEPIATGAQALGLSEKS